jgi:hypothetical protein
MSRVARYLLGLGLVSAALLAGYIGGGDILSAITGNEQDTPDLVLIAIGAGFMLAGGVLAGLALTIVAGDARAPVAILVPLAGVPWSDALGPAGGLLNAALLTAVIALAYKLSVSSAPPRSR